MHPEDAELLDDAGILRDLQSTQYWPVLQRLWQRELEHQQGCVFSANEPMVWGEACKYRGMLQIVDLIERVIGMAEYAHARR